MNTGASAVVAVDIGTSGVRSLAFGSGYRLLASAARPLTVEVDATGRAAQSWPELRAAVFEAIAEVAGAPGVKVDAIVASGTASGLAVVDGGGVAHSIDDSAAGYPGVRELVLWSDTRARAEQPQLAAVAGAAFDRTLCPAHASYWPAKLRLFARTAPPGRRYADIKGLVFGLLTGESWIDPMSAGSTGAFDSISARWDDELLAAAGVSAAALPEPHRATEVAALAAAPAERLGLRAGIPVVLGGMDGPLAQLGACGFDAGLHSCTVGTSIAYRAGHRGPLADPLQRVWCYPVLGDFWVVGGAGSNGGNAVDWLAALEGDDVASAVASAFALPPDPELVFLPYLHGERAPLWRDELSGALIGLRAHHGRADLVRAALDAVAGAAIELADVVVGLVGAPRQVRLTGGFLADEHWPQLVTDALGLPTAVPDPDQATAVGAATIGWLGLGASPAEVEPGGHGAEPREPESAATDALRSKAARAVLLRERLFP